MIFKGIPIKNIFYMLSFAFKELKQNNYEHIKGEEFEDIFDLFAEILRKGIARQLKQGLHKEYVAKTESLSTLRGRLNMPLIMKEHVMGKKMLLACDFDELSIDNIMNQVLVTAVRILLNHNKVKPSRKAELRKEMLFFKGVSEIRVKNIPWAKIRYDKNCKSYQMLHILCYFIVKSQIPTPDKDSNLKMLEFSDNDMERLFEKFVLNYYCQDEFKDLKARAETMDWDIEPDIEGENEPEWVDWWNKKMKTDIFLTLGDRTLIIDTKLNTKPLEENQFGELRFKTGYLYQLNSYVLNEDRNNPGKVDGMLLHAKTSLQTEEPYYQGHKPNGNKMMVRCLDLMQDWEGISAQLNSFLKY